MADLENRTDLTLSRKRSLQSQLLAKGNALVAQAEDRAAAVIARKIDLTVRAQQGNGGRDPRVPLTWFIRQCKASYGSASPFGPGRWLFTALHRSFRSP